MGALILLLLVTTRRIRQRQLEAPVMACPAEASAKETAAKSWRVPALSVVEQVIASLQLLWVQAGSIHAERFRDAARIEMETIAEETRCFEVTLIDLRKQIEAESLRQAQQDESLQMKATDLTRHAEEKSRLSRRLAELRETFRQQELFLSTLKYATQSAESQLQVHHSALRKLRKKAEELPDESDDPGLARAIVEFSNPTGTARNPIIVDVSAAGYRFPSTGLELRNKDLHGFTPTENPLQAAVGAIHLARTGPSMTSRPYVVLLVRPSGTLGFYPAQRILRESGIHFGYELISEDRMLAVPAAADGEVQAVRTAVLKLFARRAQYLSAAQTLRRRLRGSGDPLSEAGSWGNGSERMLEEPDGLRERFRNPGFPDENDTSTGLPHILPGSSRESLIAESSKRGVSLYDQPPTDRLPSDGRTSVTSRIPHVPPGTAQHPAVPATVDTETSWFDRNSLDEFWGNLKPIDPSKSKPGRRTQGDSTEGMAAFLRAGSMSGERPSANTDSLAVSDGVPYRSRLESDTGQMTSAFGHMGPGASRSAAALITRLPQITSYRSVSVYLDPESMTVGYRPPVSLRGCSPEQVMALLTNALYQEIRHEKSAVGGVMIPAARFVVSPGAQTLYLRLASELYRMNIPSASLFALKPYADIRDDRRKTWRPEGIPQYLLPPKTRRGAVHERRIHL